jgi:hypothetical protein
MIVSADPLDSSTAFCATIVENNGESAATVIPQNKRKIISSTAELPKRKRGENKQHKHELNRASVAILFGPYRRESMPLIMHAGPPLAIITKESRGTLRSTSVRLLNAASIRGKNAQNA